MEPQFEVLPPDRRRPAPRRKGIVGWLLALVAIAAKFGGVLLLFLKTGGTMLLSIGVYSLLFGWKFALGFVLLIFLHEMGHFVAAKAYGLQVSAPVFIPFLGAYVLLKNQPMNPWTNGVISYAGPLAGALGGWACYYLGTLMGGQVFAAIASSTFFINAINLLPVPPMDGSHLWRLLRPQSTPGVSLADRCYMALFLAALLAALALGYWDAYQVLHPSFT